MEIRLFMFQTRTFALLTKCSGDLQGICDSVDQVEQMMAQVSERHQNIRLAVGTSLGAALEAQEIFDTFSTRILGLRTESMVAHRQVNALMARFPSEYAADWSESIKRRKAVDMLGELISKTQLHVMGIRQSSFNAFAGLLPAEDICAAQQPLPESAKPNRYSAHAPFFRLPER